MDFPSLFGQWYVCVSKSTLHSFSMYTWLSKTGCFSCVLLRNQLFHSLWLPVTTLTSVSPLLCANFATTDAWRQVMPTISEAGMIQIDGKTAISWCPRGSVPSQGSSSVFPCFFLQLNFKDSSCSDFKSAFAGELLGEWSLIKGQPGQLVQLVCN